MGRASRTGLWLIGARGSVATTAAHRAWQPRQAAARAIADAALVIAVSSLPSALVRRCGQPSVIGQIRTGIVLGPSLLGHMPGHLTGHLFPRQVLPYPPALSPPAARRSAPAPKARGFVPSAAR